jgi:hypothetical protein
MKRQITSFVLKTKRNILGKRRRGTPIPPPTNRTVGGYVTKSFYEWADQLNVSTKFKKDQAVFMG